MAYGLAILQHDACILLRCINRRVLAGVCANKDFAEGDLILKDQILVGAQHSLNKVRLLLRLIQWHSLFIFYANCPSLKCYIHFMCSVAD